MMRRGNKPTKPWHGLGNFRLVAFASLLILTLFLLLLKNNRKSDTTSRLPKIKWNSFKSSQDNGKSDTASIPKIKWNSFQSTVQFHPSLKFMNGTDVLWQIPDSPKAVLFLAHGCNGRAANFWDRSLSCPNCVGLPEERLIVLHALTRRFAVVTISSAGRCWSFGKEKDKVKGIIKWFIETNKLEKLPVKALGASSGGNFVSTLATEMRFSSITLMIAEGLFDAVDIPADYPPTLFVHMPKDRRRMRLIAEHMKALKEKGISVAEIKCMEFPLTPDFLSDRIPGLDQEASSKLLDLFHAKGFVDENGYMKNDGRASRWKEAVQGTDLSFDKSELANHIQEELNLAFAYHEMTSLQSEQILEWFESHVTSSIRRKF